MISAVILTKNNQKTIKKSIEGVSFADEVIVIDDYSIDKTVAIAKRLKARVFRRKLNSNFAKQRNFGLSKARFEWILFIDSDEFVTGNLRDEILLKLETENIFNGYYVPRVDFWLGRNLNHGENNSNIIRLARKNKGKWFLAVHEVWGVRGKIGNISGRLIHYPHPGVGDFISTINSYTPIHARENRRLKKRKPFIRVVIMPSARFVMDYFIKLGFLNGVHGFVVASIMSFHSFLGWSELWLTSRKRK